MLILLFVWLCIALTECVQMDRIFTVRVHHYDAMLAIARRGQDQEVEFRRLYIVKFRAARAWRLQYSSPRINCNPNNFIQFKRYYTEHILASNAMLRALFVIYNEDRMCRWLVDIVPSTNTNGRTLKKEQEKNKGKKGPSSKGTVGNAGQGSGRLRVGRKKRAAKKKHSKKTKKKKNTDTKIFCGCLDYSLGQFNSLNISALPSKIDENRLGIRNKRSTADDMLNYVDNMFFTYPTPSLSPEELMMLLPETDRNVTIVMFDTCHNVTGFECVGTEFNPQYSGVNIRRAKDVTNIHEDFIDGILFLTNGPISLFRNMAEIKKFKNVPFSVIMVGNFTNELKYLEFRTHGSSYSLKENQTITASGIEEVLERAIANTISAKLGTALSCRALNRTVESFINDTIDDTDLNVKKHDDKENVEIYEELPTPLPQLQPQETPLEYTVIFAFTLFFISLGLSVSILRGLQNRTKYIPILQRPPAE